MNRYRAALVGCGRIGALWETDPPTPLTHAGALSMLPQVELVAGASRGREHLEWFGKRFNVTALYQDFRQMFAREQLDIVAIATHPELHKEIIIAAVESGVKGIFCEKPLALDLVDADIIVEVCRGAGCTIAVNHSRRWNPAWLRARELVVEGAIGRLVSMYGVCQGIKPYPAWVADTEGPLIHDAVHMFDLFRMYAGDARSVVGTAFKRWQPFPVEDDSQAIFQFDRGVSAVALVNELTRYSRFEMELQGTEGVITLSDGGNRLFTSVQLVSHQKEPDPLIEWYSLEESPFPPVEGGATSILRAVKDLVECMESGNRPSSTGEDGVASTEMVMAIYESQVRGNMSVELPLVERESPLYRLRAIGQL